MSINYIRSRRVVFYIRVVIISNKINFLNEEVHTLESVWIKSQVICLIKF